VYRKRAAFPARCGVEIRQTALRKKDPPKCKEVQGRRATVPAENPCLSMELSALVKEKLELIRQA
jgi:hypothetical protein